MTEGISNFQTLFAANVASLPGANLAWLQTLREQAIARFAEHGLPTRKHEDWKYTSTHDVANQQFVLNNSNANVNVPTIASDLLNNEGCYLLVFVDGLYIPALSNDEVLKSQVNVMSLKQALLDENQDLKYYLNQSPQPGADGFQLLNTAFLNDGLFLQIPKNTVIDKPLHLLFIAQNPQAFINIRNIVIAGENTKATLVEHYVGGNEMYFTNTITTLALVEQADIEHYKLQQEGMASYHVGTLLVAQAKNSFMTSHSFAFGGKWVRSDTNIELNASGAECSLNGLYCGRDKQHIDHHTTIMHNKPYGTSREYYKGILDQAAKAVFNGKVIVAQDAQQTIADQANKNLLLAKQAEVNTKPQLEIFADDVKCSHGATVGQLDESALFYLQARGLSKQQASQLLIKAFAGEIIDRVKYNGIKAKIDSLLQNYHANIEERVYEQSI